MASDFHQPRSWVASLSTLVHRRAVAPPGQRDLALMSAGSIPVISWLDCCGCMTKTVGDELAGDIVPGLVIGVVVAVEWSDGSGVVFAKVKDNGP
jgi:hypothetical protein